ncbi:zinc-dependent metalloprotease [Pelomonas sp. UHG3]|uniref:Zinc-dependent metalloprotease n=1 Tax=Roseateles hydrophilus TaxID=2975054 RepID=A0ACC6C501_9BURK|nr:zinc-dependent metalloprotease [Pelomonas sp. UHG3]MCY4743470.1 zinc-dependent metalloprotease [Pelomonas sp. UHG3]
MSRSVLATAALLALAALAQAQAPAAAPATAAAPAAPAAAAARPPVDPTAPKPFADVIKGAKEQPGLFPIWRKDDKVWLEIPKEAFNKPFLFTVNVANAVGERGLYASQMLGDEMAEWRRVGNQIQLIALNMKFRTDDAVNRRALEQSFSPSLITSGPVASAEHPDRKSVLVDASGLLLGDIPGYSTRLEAVYRLPYAPDRANSHIESTRAEAGLTTLTSRVHFATARIPAPPLTPPPVAVPTPPQATPDPRSMFFSFVYNFRALPEQPAAIRRIDPRLGHFMETYTNLGDDLKANPRVHLLTRWRLEKKDPAAALSEPVQPIVYWMDKNIPVKYREAVKAGILEWNKAFEKIGFKDAVQAKQQPDDADWDNMDATHASIRWFTGADVGFAIGPSTKDPRTGEILDADIGMSDVFGRGSRRLASDDVLGQHAHHGHSHDHGHSHAPLASWMGERSRALAEQQCTYMADQAGEFGFALDLLALRDGQDMDGPEAEALAQAVIKDVVMHEVGHTLGLKHNFRSSTTITQAQLKDKAFTEANGISNSVMDYNAYNLPLKGEPKASLTNTTLGAYDYWAIEYAYKQVPAEQEAAELARIAARSIEPQLAYADDMDQGVGGVYDGFDPRSNQRDLGDDPLAYAKKRLKLSQELWERVQTRKPQAGEDPLRARRSILDSFRQLGMTAHNVSKYVGGLQAERVVPGVTPGPAFKPVDNAQQREALRFIASGLLASDAFKFRPEFLVTQTVDYNEWERGLPLSIPDAVAAVQARVLDRLMSAATARRLIEQGAYLPEAQRKGAVSLSEVYGTLQGAIFSELKSGAEVDRMRRSLQREYVKRLQAQLNRSTNAAASYADAFSLARWHANQLAGELRTGAAKPGLSVETRAHFAELQDMLNSMLKATLTRS